MTTPYTPKMKTFFVKIIINKVLETKFTTNLCDETKSYN